MNRLTRTLIIAINNFILFLIDHSPCGSLIHSNIKRAPAAFAAGAL